MNTTCKKCAKDLDKSEYYKCPTCTYIYCPECAPKKKAKKKIKCPQCDAIMSIFNNQSL